MNHYEFKKGYMRNDADRHEINRLTRETFYFDFEDWFKNGYFDGKYIPYSYFDHDRIVSNVSVNHLEFDRYGKTLHYIQLGTVMTDPKYRKQGLARELVQRVLDDYQGKVDGIYLFANLSALEFYEKIGFIRGNQYQYVLKKDYEPENHNRACFEKVTSDNKQHKMKYLDTVKKAEVYSAFDQRSNFSLMAFYTADMENIYYSKELDCYISYDVEDNIFHLNSIISDKKQSLMNIISCLPIKDCKLCLEFTPLFQDQKYFDVTLFDPKEDYVFCYLGNDLKKMEDDRLYFPIFSHT